MALTKSNCNTATDNVVFDVQGCVAIVTGANRPNGIGHAIVEALLAAGASKVYATGRKVEQLNTLVSAHPSGKVVPVQLDMKDLSAIKGLHEKCPDVNLIVNNAGYLVTNNGPLDSIEGAAEEMAVNYLGPLALVHTFQANLKKQGVQSSMKKTSAVVNVMSICSFVNFKVAATYSCTKAAGHSLTIAQRRDLSPYNCHVMGVYPGPIDTDIGEWNKGNPMPPPSCVADAIVAALLSGEDDVFPDKAAQDLHHEFLKGPKEQEKKLLESDVGRENKKQRCN